MQNEERLVRQEKAEKGKGRKHQIKEAGREIYLQNL